MSLGIVEDTVTILFIAFPVADIAMAVAIHHLAYSAHHSVNEVA